jgi:hypothetical protein
MNMKLKICKRSYKRVNDLKSWPVIILYAALLPKEDI